MVSNNKGINLPGVAVSVPALSEKDEATCAGRCACGVDMIALSFVRAADDIDATCTRSWTRRASGCPVIAKIEKPQAVDNLDEIVDAFDGVMVARGDLGVELPLEEVPLVQKRAIELARRNAKPVIVATQMLESMIENAAPDPRRGLRRRQRRARRRRRGDAVRRDQRRRVPDRGGRARWPGSSRPPRTTGWTGSRRARHPAAHQGRRRHARPRPRSASCSARKYLVAFTQSGDSARRLSRLRSRIPMLAFTPEPVDPLASWR